MAENSSSNFLKNIFGSLYINRELNAVELDNAIKKDIDYRGYNAWILGASILIASIGLNINSTAVVIGAMLISPLMGPILGAGYAVAINDWVTLKRSLRNLGLSVGISITVSFIYFKITPIVEIQSELLARTSPTFLDVVIAFVGGIAGVLAVSRKEKSNVIPGVAIAAALMPPLCTAGFGLAIGNLTYFLGAFYLFVINCVFISTATFIFIKYFKLPKASFDEVKEKKAKRYIFIFTILTVLPSTYMLYNIVNKSNFQSKANKYVAEIVIYDNCSIISKKVEYNRDGGNSINLVMVGKHIPDSVETKWREMLKPYGLAGTNLNIVQPELEDSLLTADQIIGELMQSGFIDNMTKENREKLMEAKEEELANLRSELAHYKRKFNMPAVELTTELKTLYNDIENVSFSNMVQVKDTNAIDTLPLVIIKWPNSKVARKASSNLPEIYNFLKLRLKADTLVVKHE